MALEQVTVEYNLALEKAKAQFESFVRTVQQGEKKVTEGAVTTSKAITAEEDKAHSKRKAIRNQEEKQLIELQNKKKKAYSPAGNSRVQQKARGNKRKGKESKQRNG
jgi:hypothetical protein